MICAVLDTNVLVQAFLSDKGSGHELVKQAVLGKFVAYTSNEILAEYERILQRDFDLPAGDARRIVQDSLSFLALTFPDVRLDVIEEDPSDNRILECAVCAKAPYIVTHD